MAISTIYPIAHIVIYENGKFLLTQRKADSDDDPAFDGKWQLPGGGLEIGEHIRTVVQREAKEELGIDVDLKRTMALTEVISHGENWHGLSMAFLCKRVKPDQEIIVNEESYAYGWYTVEEAAKLDLMPDILTILNYVIRQYRLFKVGVLAVIQKENTFLLTKIHAPGKDKAHGKWSCMMGTCDINESMTDALIREVKEETNLDVSIVRPLSHIIEMFDLKIFPYLVTPTTIDQKVSLNYEASEWGWYTYEEAKKLDLYGDTEKILQQASEKV
jgi:ADP-ribose pyrophosphatase YjhB (NUDIX family)